MSHEPPAHQPSRAGDASKRPSVVSHLAVAVVALMATVAGLAAARPRLLALSLRSNEAQAVDDLLEFARAEDQFAIASFGFGELEALADPRRAPGPRLTVADPRFLSPVRNGYRFVFRAGKASSGAARARVDSGGLPSFRYVAFPVVPGRTGQRSFVYDSDDRFVHARMDGADPTIDDAIVASAER